MPMPIVSIPARYGPIKQLAFVPQDFDAALTFWTQTMGVGPFYYLEHIPLENVIYRGKAIDYDCSAAIAYWGDLEIELLRQHNEGPSILDEWLRAGREGVHHIRINVGDLEKATAEFVALGAEVIQQASLPGGGDYAMVNMPGPHAPTVELSVLHPRFDKLFAYMKKAAQSWDGRDPLRAVPPEAEWA